MSEEMLKLYDERIALFKNATEHKPIKRVPIFAQIDNWALAYANTTLKEALSDPKKEYAAYEKALTDFPFDGSLCGGITTPQNFLSSLGGGMYKGGMDTLQIATGQSDYMPPEDYDKLIANPYNYILNNILPKKFDIFNKGSVLSIFFRFSKSLLKMADWAKNSEKNKSAYKNDHGLPVLQAVPPFVAPDILLDGLRDFKGIMSDIRRCPDKVNEACLAMTKDICIPGSKYALPKPTDERYQQLFLHLPPWIKPKDFQKVYWPSFKLYTQALADMDYKMLILFEKNYAHLYDYIQDMPKNCILGFFEEDNLVEAKKALGKVICVGGGITTNDLQFKTETECLDITKKLIDDLAPGGSYVFSTHKILLSMNDAKPENLKAVTQYVRDHANY